MKNLLDRPNDDRPITYTYSCFKLNKFAHCSNLEICGVSHVVQETKVYNNHCETSINH